ncbi:helix-turn-helix domain-containing protein [Aestuariivita sp.]|jgi:cytoskeletal protein RodZ|uniref:helix-turn-helix domain-containing protein n=1 Tax=Aestuariivita sp. TaxID=1872407 RepID=UPI00216DCED3|nr:helix-turn-helix domain-containing protein [Aestuariivita sp.]MCE8006725.1 DUF4115 domain-containing protein [Aestuariivita sp.]
MIRRKPSRADSEEIAKPKGFDDFQLRLGDVMRGERATMGKSLLDVQRELRIKASYIAAIENCDPSAFDTPGFIAGYVRSYARYLNMNPDEAYDTFCQESGFTVAHGMSSEASVVKKSDAAARGNMGAGRPDPFGSSASPFAGVPGDTILSQIEPRAIGSMLVLVTLIGGLGYGGWTVLREVQQVQVAPVDQAPVVLSDLDPLNANGLSATGTGSDGFSAPSVEALDRLYRPQALDVPVLVARDAPISTLDPRTVGTFRAPDLPQTPQQAQAAPAPGSQGAVPRVVEDGAPQLRMVAVRPAWVRVTSADGTVVFEGIMEGGQSYDVPATEEPPTLRVGESGAIYFDLNGALYGPVGPRGTVTANLALSVDQVSQTMALADLDRDDDLARMVAEAAISDVAAD